MDKAVNQQGRESLSVLVLLGVALAFERLLSCVFKLT